MWWVYSCQVTSPILTCYCIACTEVGSPSITLGKYSLVDSVILRLLMKLCWQPNLLPSRCGWGLRINIPPSNLEVSIALTTRIFQHIFSFWVYTSAEPKAMRWIPAVENPRHMRAKKISRRARGPYTREFKLKALSMHKEKKDSPY